jgi:hypothetical protein
LPMPVVHFSGGALPSIPPRVYLDTSFLLRCYFARVAPPGLPPVEQAKNATCNNFLAHLHVSSLNVSLLAVEEGLHTAYFKAHIMRLSKQNGFVRWKEFRQQQPAHFQGARPLGLLEAKRFAAFLDALPIKFVDSNTYIQRSNSIPFVAKYAGLVLKKYDRIEVMDTYHLALMRVNRIDWFVTAEERLGAGFDEFSVLTL